MYFTWTYILKLLLNKWMGDYGTEVPLVLVSGLDPLCSLVSPGGPSVSRLRINTPGHGVVNDVVFSKTCGVHSNMVVEML